jgi:hypothetical protein
LLLCGDLNKYLTLDHIKIEKVFTKT